MQRRAVLKGLGASLVLLATPARAQEPWPSRPIRIVVGFAPGGTADILARKLQTPLATRLGQSIIVENRTGAGGMTAGVEVARSPADGYTLELCVSTHASLAAINKKMPYDVERDFAPVSLIVSVPQLIAAYPGALHDVLAFRMQQRAQFFCVGRGERTHAGFLPRERSRRKGTFGA